MIAIQINLSQQPQIMRLQARLYVQIEGGAMPAQANTSVEEQVSALRKVAEERTLLVVLDE